MNNYIINPSIFYWMNVIDTIRGLTIVTLIISLACIIIALICYFVGIDEEEDRVKAAKTYHKLVFIAGIIAAISTIIIIFIPDKITMIEMLITRTIYENQQFTLQDIKEAVDYIARIM